MSEIEGDVFVRRQRSEVLDTTRDTQRRRMTPTAANSRTAANRDKLNADAAKSLRDNLSKKRSSPEQATVDAKKVKVEGCSQGGADSAIISIDSAVEIAVPDPEENATEVQAEEDVDEDEAVIDEDAESPELDVVVMKIQEVESAREEIKRRLKEKQEKIIETNKVVVKDNVRFHELGYKDRYYGDTFKRKDLAMGGGLDKMCETYVQGLCWVLQYYYQGWYATLML